MSKRKNKDVVAASDNTIEEIATENQGLALTDEAAIDAALAAIEGDLTVPTVPLAEVETIELDAGSEGPVEDEAIGHMISEGGPDHTDHDEPIVGETDNVVEASEDSEAIETPVGDVEVDVDAVLAEVEAEDAAGAPAPTPTTSSSPKRTKAVTTATPAAPKRSFHDVAAIDAATLKANLDACAAKKVQEKAQNLIQAIEAGKRLSRFTSIAVRKLVDDGKVSGPTLVEALQGVGLSTGTARAQAQQMTTLFKISGIAQPSPDNGRELVLADKGLVEELVRMAA